MSVLQYNRNMNINVVAAIPSNTIQNMTVPFHIKRQHQTLSTRLQCVSPFVYIVAEKERIQIKISDTKIAFM